MKQHDEATLIVSLRPGERRDFLSEHLHTIGIDAASGPRRRWYDPNLLTLRLDRKAAESAESDLRERAEVMRVAVLAEGERLATHWPCGGGAAGCISPPPSARCTREAVTLSNGAVIGGNDLTVIAGPCSVESPSQIREVAAMVKEAGASALRGGAFKPRTDPYSFGGLEEEGLRAMARAGEETGLPVVTEAPDTGHLDLVAAYADVIQIGSRNMHTFPFLFNAGRHRAGSPLLLKRGFGATIDEFLLAAEYILLGRFSAGFASPGVILCERGIRTFETATRFTLDVGAVAVLKERTPLPLIVDPSHAAGDRRYVSPLARAALAAGADGLIVEAHTDPAAAWSDARQCLGPADLRALAQDVLRLSAIRLNRP